LKEQLDQALTSHLAKNNTLPNLAIIGIGNELNGDDAAGVLIVRHLNKSIINSDKLLLIEASIAPENFTGVIRKFKPDWVWIFDAAGLNLKPGAFQLINLGDVESIGADTHRLPPTLFLNYLQLENDFHPFLFGIQPESVEPFSELSPPVKNTIKETSKFLLQWLQNTYNI
jgi:hydrogenase 3 maturation protease